MNKNQKIAIGCGAAGCLGLIGLIIIAVCVYVFVLPSMNLNRNSNTNVNRSSTRNDNENDNANSNTSSSDGTTSSSSLSDDDKHKLFQAAATTRDSDLMQNVWKKLGIAKADGTPNDQYAEFAKEHIGWLFKNAEFLKTIDTVEKARAYVDAHMND